MKLQLPNSVTSPQDLKMLILDIREYARWFSHNEVKSRVAGKAESGEGKAPSGTKTAETPPISEAVAEILQKLSGGKPLSQESLDKLIIALEDYEKSAPQLTITLAAPPSGKLKTTLAGWCRENIEPGILVNFRFNSTLLGGMVVNYGSRIFDWSFRRQILAERGHFPEVLRNV